MPTLRARLLISTIVGIGSGLYCWMMLTHLQVGAYDFTWALYPARDLLAGRNPYTNVPPGAVAYPMPAVLLAVPFAWLHDTAAAASFFGISSGLLAFGLTRHGFSRLLVFLAYPYWSGLLAAQWTPLLMASAFFPYLLPVTAAKPQIGIPVFLTHWTKRGVLACGLFIGLSILVMPGWIRDWLRQALRYEHFFPILVLPGPLLLLALRRYRDRDAWLLLFSAFMPQRWFFDAFVLWLIPKSRREVLWTALISWGAGIWRWYHFPHSFAEVGRWAVIFLYLPMLAVVLLRRETPIPDSETAQSRT